MPKVIPGNRGRTLFSPTLCLVTAPDLTGGWDKQLTITLKAIEGGVNMVQVRYREGDEKAALAFGSELLRARGERCLITLNPGLCEVDAVDYDYTHLSEHWLSTDMTPPAGRWGMSVHSVDKGRLALNKGAGYLFWGNVFETKTHPDRPSRGTHELQNAVTECNSIPIIAIGGIDQSNIAAVARTGVHGVAVIRAISEAPQPEVAAARLQNLLKLNYRGVNG